MPSITQSINACPYCGGKLNLPYTPRFCPNCGQGFHKGMTRILKRGGILFAVLAAVLILAVGIMSSLPRHPEIAQDPRQAEWDTVQTGVDSLMADQKITRVLRPPSDTSQNDFTVLPKYTFPDGVTGNVFASHYIREGKTTFFYCWETTGKITRQDTEAKPGCT